MRTDRRTESWTNPFTERILSSLEQNPETEKVGVARLLYLFTGLYERWQNGLEARRHPNGYHEPDYERILREREGQVEVRVEGYHEGGDKHSWKDWILGIIALAIVAWLGRISLQMDELTKVIVRQDIQEKEIAALRCTVYKVCP
jgi:hypothetical protein